MSYTVRRLFQMLVVMWVVATIVFVLFRIIPGDPATVIVGREALPEAVALMQAELGLDRPLVVQYVTWLGDTVRGDLGTAYTQGGIPARDVIMPALLRSIELAFVSMILAAGLAIPLGIRAAVKAGSWTDGATRTIAVVAFSVPSFWLAILFILLFAVRLDWVPISGFVPLTEDPTEHIKRMILPAATIGFIQTGILLRFMRASMVSVLAEDYIRTAHAKGATLRRVHYRHALRNASIPFVTVMGVSFGGLVGGAVIVEQIFSWPGLGWLMVESIRDRSFDVIQGAVLVASALFVLINFAVDIAYTRLDPRITYLED
jgi:peptide/nickel transport system permease protein